METTTAGVTIQSPQLDIETVAAGGGSMLFWENGLLRVGPESAGASPGPACYRKGGPLTITDANMILGRLIPSYFPSIFGPNEDLPLDLDIVKEKFAELAGRIADETGSSKTPEELALGFLAVASETMCNPIRTLSEGRGHEVASHHLAVFGGAGGQAACDVAKSLGISRVLLPKTSSILSAVGIALADVVNESQESFAGTTNDSTAFNTRLEALDQRSRHLLVQQGFEDDDLKTIRYLNMRYEGADATLMIQEPTGHNDWAGAFKQQHQLEFGFSHESRAVRVDDLRVRVVASHPDNESRPSLSKQIEDALTHRRKASAREKHSVCFSSGWAETNVFHLGDLVEGTTIAGPAMIVDNTQTIVIHPDATAIITPEHVVIELASKSQQEEVELVVDPVQLSVFGHRFMAISEQMGRSLQKTAVSVNIKERMDFSCALFDPEGRLVANAPHVPAMLGSMQFAVKWQADHWAGKLYPGDVLLSNHPIAGGVHLPDITVVTPVFDAAGKEVIFCRYSCVADHRICADIVDTASRGHHADVGGITPGSMPPQSRTIFDEGAAIVSFKVVSQGEFDEGGLIKLLIDEPAKHNYGTRTLSDNISDIHAQIAATSVKSGFPEISADRSETKVFIWCSRWSRNIRWPSSTCTCAPFNVRPQVQSANSSRVLPRSTRARVSLPWSGWMMGHPFSSQSRSIPDLVTPYLTSRVPVRRFT